MIKTAKQLKDLIRNLSKAKAADAQLLMRNYMMERFLERISLSEYRDKFILKGGIQLDVFHAASQFSSPPVSAHDRPLPPCLWDREQKCSCLPR